MTDRISDLIGILEVTSVKTVTMLTEGNAINNHTPLVQQLCSYVRAGGPLHPGLCASGGLWTAVGGYD